MTAKNRLFTIEDYQPEPNGDGVAPTTTLRLTDFVAYMETHSYIFKPTGALWPASSVNARVPPVTVENGNNMSATAWLDANAPVEQITWAPGLPLLITGKLIKEGGWIEDQRCTVFNLYRPPPPSVLTNTPAEPWVAHISNLYGDDGASHIIKWLAHRVQHPEQKVNHALVLGGAQGIGKDTLLEPVKRAIGHWNFAEVSPQHMLGRFNGFLKSVICRVSEARDLGEIDRFKFYDHMKSYLAAPPDTLRVDEKHMREYAIANVMGVIITTNHKTDGIFLPPDDRRHYVAWSGQTKERFGADYFADLYRWFADDGNEAVAAYLSRLDISDFDPKAPPPKTQAFWEIVDASRAPEDSELADALDALGWPDIILVSQIVGNAPDAAFAEWLRDRRNARRVPHRLEACGYVAVRNTGAKDGAWKIGSRRQVVYGKSELSERDRIEAAMRVSGAR